MMIGRLFITAVLSISVLLACEQQPNVQPVDGFVSASDAYLKHFGEPPQGKKGRAYARVAYLPIKNNPGKIRAFPALGIALM